MGDIISKVENIDKPERPGRKCWLTFIITSIGIGVVSVDGSIVNVALPEIIKTFHTSFCIAQWTISIYLFAICALLLPFGRLTDVFEKKTIYLSGFFVFTLGSLFCGFSHSLFELILFRLVQGIGAALILSSNQALLVSIFPALFRGKILGFNASIVALGSLMGPVLGGYFVYSFGWRSIFFINLPLGIIGGCLGVFFLPKLGLVTKIIFDIVGFVLLFCTIFLLLFMLNPILYSKMVYILLDVVSLSIFGTCLFYWISKVKNPIIELKLFKNKWFSQSVISSFIVYFVLFSNNVIWPYYLTATTHLNIAKIGIILSILPLSIMLVSPFNGYASNKLGFKNIINIGLSIVAFGLFVEIISTSAYLLIIAQVLIGLGIALFLSPNSHMQYHEVNKKKYGVVGSTGSLARNLGKIFGVSVSTFIFTGVQSVFLHSATNHAVSTRYSLKLLLVFLFIMMLLLIYRSLVSSKSSPIESMDKRGVTM